ncbi:MAG: NUDIX hydrolase [Simkaniaceae bacterium]|nr:NUDIX hydrolase [Candidatus Sacchlamyda saccharinae]
MKWPLLLISVFSSLCADIDYHSLLDQFSETLGRRGSWEQGEIEIATTPSEIKRIENAATQRYIRMGYSKEDAKRYSTCGIIADDHYCIWIRDAVTFPGGIPGTYDRIAWKSGLSGPPGAIVLPVLKNKKVLVNVNFRHATRAWEIELPQGFREENETAEQAARRELKEEAGAKASELIYLGDIAPHMGLMTTIVPVYLAKVSTVDDRHQDEGEAINANIELSQKEIKQAYDKGYVILSIKGQATKVYCRDPSLSFALMQAKWKKLI